VSESYAGDPYLAYLDSQYENSFYEEEEAAERYYMEQQSAEYEAWVWEQQQAEYDALTEEEKLALEEDFVEPYEEF
jgi:hypothetical protein